jgi:hypothetical protein
LSAWQGGRRSGYQHTDPQEDLSFNDRDSAPGMPKSVIVSDFFDWVLRWGRMETPIATPRAAYSIGGDQRNPRYRWQRGLVGRDDERPACAAAGNSRFARTGCGRSIRRSHPRCAPASHLHRAIHSLVPFPDALGSRERINVPGSVGEGNWSYRMSVDIETLGRDHDVTARLNALAAETDRGPTGG